MSITAPRVWLSKIPETQLQGEVVKKRLLKDRWWSRMSSLFANVFRQCSLAQSGIIFGWVHTGVISNVRHRANIIGSTCCLILFLGWKIKVEFLYIRENSIGPRQNDCHSHSASILCMTSTKSWGFFNSCSMPWVCLEPCSCWQKILYVLFSLRSPTSPWSTQTSCLHFVVTKDISLNEEKYKLLIQLLLNDG